MAGYIANNTAELLIEAKNGNSSARDILVRNNLGLVWSIVRKFSNRGYEQDDLFQIGCIGLLKAITKFDQSFDVKFSTYAVPMIIGEIRRFLRDDGIIKVSRSLKQSSTKVRYAKDQLLKELGRDPTIKEISDYSGLNEEEIVMASEASWIPESLFNTAGESDNGLELMGKISADAQNENDIVDKLALREILEKLGIREKQIIFMRYFRQKTQIQTACSLGISQVQVSRLEKKIIESIRKSMNM